MLIKYIFIKKIKKKVSLLLLLIDYNYLQIYDALYCLVLILYLIIQFI